MLRCCPACSAHEPHKACAQVHNLHARAQQDELAKGHLATTTSNQRGLGAPQRSVCRVLCMHGASTDIMLPPNCGFHMSAAWHKPCSVLRTGPSHHHTALSDCLACSSMNMPILAPLKSSCCSTGTRCMAHCGPDHFQAPRMGIARVPTCPLAPGTARASQTREAAA